MAWFCWYHEGGGRRKLYFYDEKGVHLKKFKNPWPRLKKNDSFLKNLRGRCDLEDNSTSMFRTVRTAAAERSTFGEETQKAKLPEKRENFSAWRKRGIEIIIKKREKDWSKN